MDISSLALNPSQMVTCGNRFYVWFRFSLGAKKVTLKLGVMDDFGNLVDVTHQH
jgi:hypothetical protein